MNMNKTPAIHYGEQAVIAAALAWYEHNLNRGFGSPYERELCRAAQLLHNRLAYEDSLVQADAAARAEAEAEDNRLIKATRDTSYGDGVNGLRNKEESST